MKTISATAIVTLMTITAGLTAVVPAMAQDARPRIQQHIQHDGNGPGRHFSNHRFGPNGPGHNRPGFAGPGRASMLGGLLAFGRDSQTIEIALVRLAHRIDLTETQQALLDTFKTDALAAQADFATATAALRPSRGDTAGATPRQRPDMAAQLDRRIALEQAHLTALTAVQPAFEAFFDSLTDAQKAKLTPHHNNRRSGWQGRHNQPPMPGQDRQIEGNGGPADAAPEAPEQPTPLKS